MYKYKVKKIKRLSYKDNYLFRKAPHIAKALDYKYHKPKSFVTGDHTKYCMIDLNPPSLSHDPNYPITIVDLHVTIPALYCSDNRLELDGNYWRSCYHVSIKFKSQNIGLDDFDNSTSIMYLYFDSTHRAIYERFYGKLVPKGLKNRLRFLLKIMLYPIKRQLSKCIQSDLQARNDMVKSIATILKGQTVSLLDNVERVIIQNKIKEIKKWDEFLSRCLHTHYPINMCMIEQAITMASIAKKSNYMISSGVKSSQVKSYAISKKNETHMVRTKYNKTPMKSAEYDFEKYILSNKQQLQAIKKQTEIFINLNEFVSDFELASIDFDRCWVYHKGLLCSAFMEMIIYDNCPAFRYFLQTDPYISQILNSFFYRKDIYITLYNLFFDGSKKEESTGILPSSANLLKKLISNRYCPTVYAMAFIFGAKRIVEYLLDSPFRLEKLMAIAKIDNYGKPLDGYDIFQFCIDYIADLPVYMRNSIYRMLQNAYKLVPCMDISRCSNTQVKMCNPFGKKVDRFVSKDKKTIAYYKAMSHDNVNYSFQVIENIRNSYNKYILDNQNNIKCSKHSIFHQAIFDFFDHRIIFIVLHAYLLDYIDLKNQQKIQSQAIFAKYQKISNAKKSFAFAYNNEDDCMCDDNEVSVHNNNQYVMNKKTDIYFIVDKFFTILSKISTGLERILEREYTAQQRGKFFQMYVKMLYCTMLKLFKDSLLHCIDELTGEIYHTVKGIFKSHQLAHITSLVKKASDADRPVIFVLDVSNTLVNKNVGYFATDVVFYLGALECRMLKHFIELPKKKFLILWKTTHKISEVTSNVEEEETRNIFSLGINVNRLFNKTSQLTTPEKKRGHRAVSFWLRKKISPQPSDRSSCGEVANLINCYLTCRR